MRQPRAGDLLSRRAALFALVPLAACATRQRRQEPEDFAPLTYEYLTPIPLNVATIDIDRRAAPVPVAGDPVSPVEVVARMARDRLQAVGTSGRAVFVINEAVVGQGATAYEGSLAVELDVYTSADVRAAFAEARVSGRRSIVGDEGRRRALYELTKQLVDQLNIEFEFQVRRSMRDWLVVATPDAPAPAPVQEQALPPPVSGPPTPGSLAPESPAPESPNPESPAPESPTRGSPAQD